MPIVPIDRLTHLHVSTDSRDCDGRYEHDYIVVPREGVSFRQLWAAHVEMLASRDYDECAEFERTTDRDGLPCVEYSARTDEGYRREYTYGCDGECDPRVYRYRDHTAEAMGY